MFDYLWQPIMSQQQTEITRILQLGSCERPYDYYRVLNLWNDNLSDSQHLQISQDQIRQRYRQFAQLIHPDKGGNAQAFSILNDAYSVLSDPEQREVYDLDGIKETQLLRQWSEMKRAFLDYFNPPTDWIPTRYGSLIQKLFKIVWVMLMMLRFFGLVAFLVFVDVFDKQYIKQNVVSGVIVAFICYMTSRSLIYVGCMWCFKFSTFCGFWIGMLLWHYKTSILIIIVQLIVNVFKRAVSPSKKVAVITICILAMVGKYFYGLSWKIAWLTGIGLWLFRDVILGIIGLGSLIARLMKVPPADVIGVTFIVAALLKWVFSFSWISVLLVLCIGIIITAVVMYPEGSEAVNEESENTEKAT